MSTVTKNPGYEFPLKDTEGNFHGNRVVYFNWEKHLMFCAPIAFPLPPAMPFAAVTGELLPTYWGAHPEFSKVDWAKAQWTLDGKPWSPDPAKSLGDLGVKHKSVIRLTTPGLAGFNAS